MSTSKLPWRQRLRRVGGWPGGAAIAAGIAAILMATPSPAGDLDDFEADPIRYSQGANDPVAELQRQLERGDLKLAYDNRHGYLPALLRALDIPLSSQVLVFSKTSLQQRLISPRTPRAVYFNDDVYIGWVPGGEVIEVSSVDPHRGGIFYTVDQRKERPARFVRRDECLQCHASPLTDRVPGHLVRSVSPDPEGLPIFNVGTRVTTHESPLGERWGGWYVTGTHGKQRHMGNVVATSREDPELDLAAGANVTDLGEHFATKRYLSPHSDIVALMVLGHQARMHNLITRASYRTKIAVQQQRDTDRVLERPQGTLNASTKRRIDNAVRPLVDYLLFVNEAPLTEPIRGTSNFAREFVRQGPTDRRGRSLRDLDLDTRLLTYPCSFLIYSDAFERLPPIVKERTYRRLWEVLKGIDDSEKYSHLSRWQRQAILEILLDTKTDLPGYWRPEQRRF